MKLLQIDFPMEAPFGGEMSEAFAPLAHDIAAEEGVIWKIWTENAATKEAGGIYFFLTRPMQKDILTSIQRGFLALE